jgi:KDO2-lipid IV(A) lauroyltransferase
MKELLHLSKKSISLQMIFIKFQLFVGDLIGIIWFDIFRIRRQIALANLKLCFPEWSEAQRIIVARKSVQNLGRSLVEFLRVPFATKEKWCSHFHIHGVENLKKAQAQNKGVFLLSAHMGSVDWATVGFSMHGYSMCVISKKFKFKLLNDFWYNARARWGTEFIEDRGSALTILRLLKQKKMIAYMLDQFLGPPIGVKTRFFGHETGTPVGLALLASRSGAPVVPIYTYRDEIGDHHLVLEPEINFEILENKEDTLIHMTQKYCDQIELWVRKRPEQWMWIHRRWKEYKY